MKVQLLGDVIDLQKIYKIGEIIATPYSNTKISDILSYGFTIYFVNHINNEVSIQPHIIAANQGGENPYHPHDKFIRPWKTYENEALRLIMGVRDNLIRLWNDNEPEYPEIEFGKPKFD